MGYLDGLITGILFIIMLNVGMSLELKSFSETLTRPKSFFTGLILQLVFLPLFALGLMLLTDLPAAIKVGFVILAACPGGMTSNFITYLINASTALSISMTVTNSVLALVTIPFWVNLALSLLMGTEADLRLSFTDTMQQIFIVTIIPVTLGILLHQWRRAWAEAIERRLKWVTVVLLAVLFIIKFFAGEEYGGSGIRWAEVWMILPFSLIVNAAGMWSGFFFGKHLRLSVEDRATIGIEVGIQNTSLAFLIASVFLHNEDMLKPALVYAMFSFFTAVGFGLWMKPESMQRSKHLLSAWLSGGRR
jgi:BASS family bile acid:Na+ symporter